MKVIVTGTTGMVGEGVTLVCLSHPDIEKVLVVGRRPSGINHSKLEEIVLPDLTDLTYIEEQLKGYDACLFCLGISSVGMNPEDYYRTTYTLTMNFAETAGRLNPGIVFEYVSGVGTDSTEKGSVRWARVKGKTENDLMKLETIKSYNLRPGFIKPIKGMIRTNKLYKYVKWTYPIGRKLYTAGFCTLNELTLTMIYLVKDGYNNRIISGLDIIELAKKEQGG